ncbi:hypothetical protein GGI35DRAFT_493641 [Trichoderma velutinum]
MAFQRLFHILLGAALAATSVQASPYVEVDFFGLQARNLIKARDISVPNPTCVPFQIGNSQNPPYVLSGTGVCVTVSGSNFVFTYPTLPAGSSYNDVHMWIGTSPPTASTPGTAPGQFPYSNGPGKGCTITAGGTGATCTIPISDWQLREILVFHDYLHVSSRDRLYTGLNYANMYRYGYSNFFNRSYFHPCSHYYSYSMRQPKFCFNCHS